MLTKDAIWARELGLVMSIEELVLGQRKLAVSAKVTLDQIRPGNRMIKLLRTLGRRFWRTMLC
jgi:hypothetical protein